MENMILVYWTQSGNTQQMAEAIAEGVKQAGASIEVMEVAAQPSLDGYQKILFGCPAMGAEVLEECEFDPYFTSIEASLNGKSVALFGSYGWGDGEWMRNWEERVMRTGANLYENGLIIHETPDDAGLAQCRSFGEAFAKCSEGISKG